MEGQGSQYLKVDELLPKGQRQFQTLAREEREIGQRPMERRVRSIADKRERRKEDRPEISCLTGKGIDCGGDGRGIRASSLKKDNAETGYHEEERRSLGESFKEPAEGVEKGQTRTPIGLWQKKKG